MIQVMATLARSTCANCGMPVCLMRGDLEREGTWFHEPVPGSETYEEHCFGQMVAEPAGGTSG